MAGSMADLIMHPVDTINTRLKVSRAPPVRGGTLGYAVQTVYNEGVFSLYRGIGATMAQAVPMNAFWFVTYEGFKRQGIKHFDEEYAPAIHFCSAAFGELVSSVFYVPFDVVKTRMQLGANPQLSSAGNVSSQSNYAGTFSALGAIWRSEGISGLYSGYRACIVSDCSVSALQFMFYEKLKCALTEIRQDRKLREEAQQDSTSVAVIGNKMVSSRSGGLSIENGTTSAGEPDSRDVFLAGAMAGSTAAFLTNPIDTMTVTTDDSRSLCHQDSQQQLRWEWGLTFLRPRYISRRGCPCVHARLVSRSARFGALGAIQLALYEKLKLVFGFVETMTTRENVNFKLFEVLSFIVPL